MLKVVKVNEREITTQKHVGYSSRTVNVKSKTHDLEVHHEDGYPVFSVSKKSYGRGYDFDWHPHMLEEHPQLGHSFEFARKHNYKDFEANSKDSLGYQTQNLYANAARRGFKDAIPSRSVPRPSSHHPMRMVHTFYDPDDGTHIVTHDTHAPVNRDNFFNAHNQEPEPGTSSPKTAYTNEFKAKHHLDDTQINNTFVASHPQYSSHNPKSAYNFAKKLYAIKGKRVKAIGLVRSALTSSDSSKVYKAAEGVSNEELSAHHEAVLKKQAGSKLTTFVRHSPTSFHATEKVDEKNQYHHSSVVDDGKLFHHQFKHVNEYEHNITKLTHSF